MGISKFYTLNKQRTPDGFFKIYRGLLFVFCKSNSHLKANFLMRTCLSGALESFLYKSGTAKPLCRLHCFSIIFKILPSTSRGDCSRHKPQRASRRQGQRLQQALCRLQDICADLPYWSEGIPKGCCVPLP